MARRTHHLPWRAAGAAAERQSVDGVVRSTAWAFAHRASRELDTFVGSGDSDLTRLLTAFELPLHQDHTVIDIGAGIGRMTPAFTARFSRVIACDLDAAFLERCRETVARYGNANRLQTVHIADGRTLVVPDHTAQLTFSMLTLPHCAADEAIALTREALRVTAPGGYVALQYRAWSAADVVLRPGGRVARQAFRVPALGDRLARWQPAARLGWHASRMDPATVMGEVGDQLDDVRLFRGPGRPPFAVDHAGDGVVADTDTRHWWLVGRVHQAPQPA